MRKNKRELLVLCGYRCNNNCIFCNAESSRKAHINRSTQEIKETIISNSKDYNEIMFIGGEFTIRDDAIDLIGLAKKKGYKKIAIETNGRMFAINNFTKRILKAGLNNITFSIHGSCAKTHDGLTRVKNSFAQCMEGLKNTKRHNVNIYINFVINKLNYKEIPLLVEKFGKLPNLTTIGFSFIRPPVHMDYDFIKEITPLFTEILPYLKSVEKKEKVKFQNIPKCVFNSKRVISQDHKRRIYKNYGLFEEKSDLYTSLENEFIKYKFCNLCLNNGRCIGILKRYCEVYGKEEFKPLK